VKDFSAAKNLAGSWSYGYRTAAGAFVLLPSNDNTRLEPGLTNWYLPTPSWDVPAIIRNNTGSALTYFTYVNQPVDMLNLLPGPNGEKTVLRWTAPAAMLVQIETRFRGLDTRGSSADIAVVHNSTATLTSISMNGTGNTSIYSASRKVNAGDVIDVLVGYGSNYNPATDSIGVAAVITQVFDTASEFSAAKNPAGSWSYGYRTAAGAFALLPNNDNVYGLAAGMSTWYTPNSGANLPSIVHNGTSATQMYFGYVKQPNYMLNLQPGPGGEKSVVRWTAPNDMLVKIEGRFEGLDTRGGTSDVSIVQNSASILFSGGVNAYGGRAPFSLTRSVYAGDVIDFAVGFGGDNNHNADSTGLVASISPVQLPIAHWKFDEGAGTVAVDATGTGFTGTLETPARIAGKIGAGALDFNGSGDYVGITRNETLPEVVNNFTASFWAYPHSTHQIYPESADGNSGEAGQRYVLSMWSAFSASGPSISVGTNGVSVFESGIFNNSATLVYQAPITGWNHIAVVYESRRPKLYVNGVLVRTGLISGFSSVGGHPYSLGGGNYDGLLDDARIYNRAMTAAEVKALSAAPTANPAPTVVITDPLNGAVETAPVNINLSANATDNGAVRKVEFYANGNLIATKTEQPYSATWGNVAAGTYSITAKATDDAGLTTTSSAVSITVNPEGRAVVSPPVGSRLITADVVALDQVFFYNRLGAFNPGGMIYALRRDVVPINPGRGLVPGNVQLRPDKRPRPLVLRMNVGDRLQIRFQNLLAPSSDDDNRPATRTAGVHVVGLQLAHNILDDGSNVGQNQSGLVAPGGTATYTFYAEREGNHLLYSSAATTGGEGDGGSLAMGLFGSVNVEPTGAEWYRSQVTAQDLAYATTGKTPASQPIVNYDAVYPAGHPRAGTPILKMLHNSEIVHADLNAIITGPSKGRFPAGTFRPNATEPDREQPFREFTVIYHDEIKAVQAFPEFFEDPVLSHTLHSVRDGFAINYGTGGIGAEILANRLGVGPMHACTECKYEEFFLSAWTVGDPAQIVDIMANTKDGAGNLITGAKATKVFYPDDPSNVHHSYLNDHVKFRVTHAGPKEHHVHHLHAHQWLRTPDSDNSSYLDSQALGPGYSFTAEITHGGSGNRNKTAGDSIFHCHFYPHFAQGMWELWRVHDVFEEGTKLEADGRPAPNARALPDGEIAAGTPIPALVPLPTIAMAPVPTASFKGFPFYIPGVAGHRPPHPPLDTVDDGGLPRHVITGGTFEEHHTRLDFDKKLLTAVARAIPESGTAEEIEAMNFHGRRTHASYTPGNVAANFITNGLPRKNSTTGLGGQPGAPFADPCIDDNGNAVGNRRVYKSANLQLDVKLNKAGWHFPQQRISVLWEDVAATRAGTRPPEPLFFRANTNDCIEFHHTNLVPHVYAQDDFQVRTPTDIMGQHIHLVKFDVTSSDGAGNGFNYEDGSFAPGEVQERVHAINAAGGLTTTAGARVPLTLKQHPQLGLAGKDEDGNGIDDWLGAQTTVQRWFADNTLNNNSKDRTLRTVFTHDHFGPSTHQQVGLYAGLVVEPQGSAWKHNETGQQFYTRADGGPTSWQAIISTPNSADSYREFLLEFSDFQLAYRPDGTPVNPPAKREILLSESNLLIEPRQTCPGGAPRPCPEAVSADDPGTMSVNYRSEPLALRIYDPQTKMQAAGEAGDLAHVFRSNVARADARFNAQPNFYPALTGGLQPGDPFTPLLRAYENDKVQIRVLVGGFEEGHNFGVHGIKWKFEPDDPNSGYRSNQMMGISEHYEFVIPKMAKNSVGAQDYLYLPGEATDDLWNGLWGIMRAYNSKQTDLQTLPNNANGFGPAVSNPGDFNGVCPKTAPVKDFDITAVTAHDALPERTLVYNSRTNLDGKLHDPTAIMFFRTEDLDSTTRKLKTGVPIEPLILRANAGDCLQVTLNNNLPSLAPDLNGYSTLPMIVEKFNNNQIAPSTDVGLHAQLLHFDVTKSNGINVGLNPVQTARAGLKTTYQWYAGEVVIDSATGVGTAQPIEFGAINLQPSDPIKHPGKGAVGALVIEPQGATWREDANARAQATVTKTDGTTFREFVLVFQNDVNLRYGNMFDAVGNTAAVRNTAEMEDPEDSGQKAFNYRSEPLWKRMNFAPHTSLEETRTFDFTNVLSDAKVGGPPVTPVFTAAAGQPVRLRLVMPGGHGRNSVFNLHGHIWEEEPYLNGSAALGSNPLSEWKGAQYGIGPGSHFDLLLKNGAGGKFAVPGDYLYRNQTSSLFDGGMWGIFRVTEASTTPPPMNVALASNGATATASSQYNSTYPAAAAINGDRYHLMMADGRYNLWNSAVGAQKPDWLEITFAGPKVINEISVITQQDDYANATDPTEATTFTRSGITSFEVQYLSGTSWVTVPGGSVTGNDKVWRRFSFPAITTPKIRVLVHATVDTYSRIWEVEAWTP
jgi:hypothetical protein